MPTYVYETTDPAKPVKRYEIEQRMTADALTVHPETGEAIQRVISGGLGFIGLADKAAPAPGPCGMGACGSGDCPMPPMGGGGCGSGMCGHSHH